MEPFINPSYIIAKNEEFSLSHKYNQHEQPTCCIFPCPLYPFPSGHDPMVAMKHNVNDKDHDEDHMLEVV